MPLRSSTLPEDDSETRGRSRSNSQSHLQASQQGLGMGRPGVQAEAGVESQHVSMISFSLDKFANGHKVAVCLRPKITGRARHLALKRQGVRAGSFGLSTPARETFLTSSVDPLRYAPTSHLILHIVFLHTNLFPNRATIHFRQSATRKPPIHPSFAPNQLSPTECPERLHQGSAAHSAVDCQRPRWEAASARLLSTNRLTEAVCRVLLVARVTHPRRTEAHRP